MSNLDNLTTKVLADSEQKAAKMIADAEATSQKVIAEQEAVANQEKDRILAEARDEAARIGDLITLSKSLAIRDENLRIKHQVLNDVFAKAIERLNAMPEDQFIAFIGNYLKNMALEGYEIILPKRHAGLLDQINQAVAAKGCTGTLTLSKDSREIDGGFILCKGGVEMNNTFESLVDYYRYEMETNVMKTLY